MKIEFKYGPVDGKQVILLAEADSMIVHSRNKYYEYRKTNRIVDGRRIFQYIGLACHVLA